MGEVMAWGRWLCHGEESGGVVVKGRQPGRLTANGEASGGVLGCTEVEHTDHTRGSRRRRETTWGCGWKITGEGDIVSKRKRGSIRERERKRECARVGKDGEQLEIWVKMVEKW